MLTLEELGKKIDDVWKWVQITLIPNINEKSRDIKTLKERIGELTASNAALIKHIKMLESRIKALESRQVNSSVTPQNNVMSASLDTIVQGFNVWAANPVLPLPNAFYYLANNDMRIRTAQSTDGTNAASKWISNKEGSKKYLFPNPNWLDQNTDISELYTIDLSKLTIKGRNKLKIKVPCEMTDIGYINYTGELELL
ncbi:MAG: hypothetical protein Ta2A_18270 [Treponemataceae bacterium]|nr:MAG: hypothetical protein Ta2A_18270 [Treponemataceae bacterium]